MYVLICPGFHDRQLTENFIEGLKLSHSWSEKLLIFPVETYPAYSGFHILEFLQASIESPIETPLIFISFSAGVVGAIAAAWGWQMSGGNIKAFIAIDGWGVPLAGNFPIHRISHDYFTHWSSALLGSGADSFYAEPPVEHLELWRSPHNSQGIWVNCTSTLLSSAGLSPQVISTTYKDKNIVILTAAEFITHLLKYYRESR